MVTHAFTDYTFYSITIISVTRTCILYNNLSTSQKKSLFIKQFDRLCFFLIFTLCKRNIFIIIIIIMRRRIFIHTRSTQISITTVYT